MQLGPKALKQLSYCKAEAPPLRGPLGRQWEEGEEKAGKQSKAKQAELLRLQADGEGISQKGEVERR